VPQPERQRQLALPPEKAVEDSLLSGQASEGVLAVGAAGESVKHPLGPGRLAPTGDVTLNTGPQPVGVTFGNQRLRRSLSRRGCRSFREQPEGALAVGAALENP
jgi:hypothetical protein